ncbi:hypothetical protein NHP190002_12380 [Helicobacter ailurogastricus]|uniref:hypothetical protein n=1 Tax=Helicobacter ailurogastricus TaxID=1578720 RepID=UPI00244D91E0|nr:hypothetical protein [Helicobacter ailurogastricus]GMB90536.1 hypothetical protein NHP190002_12380 [Helicobacter ailurogastricus]
MYRKAYITFKTASYMQKLTAKVLRMQRGKPKHNVYDYQGNIIIKGTGRKRIEPRAYAQLMEQEKGKHQKMVQDMKEWGFKLAKKANEVTANINDRLTESFEIIGLDELDTLNAQINAQIKIETQNEKDIVKACKIGYDTWINCINDNLYRYKADSQEYSILKPKHEQAKQDNQRLENTNKTLEQEKQELKQDYQALETAIVDLASVVDQIEQDKNPPLHLDKKLTLDKKFTTKELTAICGNVRKYMIDVNAKFGELKLYSQKIYVTVNALKQQRLTIVELKNKLIEIDKQAKADYEVLAGKIKTAETAKANLETVINTAYSTLIEPKEQDNRFTAQDKLKAIEDKGQEQKTTISGLNEAIKSKDKALEDMEALKTANTEQAEQLKKVETLKTALQELKDKCDTLADDLTEKSNEVTQAIESVQTLQDTNAEQARRLQDRLLGLKNTD